MCHDISYSATSIELVTDYLPHLVFDKQISFDFSHSIHVLAQAFRMYPVILEQDGKPHLKYFEWGLIADYMNTSEKIKEYRSSMVNARSEKIMDDKRSVWYRIRNQRCLIPVTGFFEHREIRGWKNKVPYHINLCNNKFFFLLGLYNYSPVPEPETGEVRGTFSIITRTANEKMAMIHNHGANKNRMPVLYQPQDAIRWIKNSLSEIEIREILNYQAPSEELEVCPVFTIRTTKERPDGKLKTEVFNWDGLPKLGNDNSQTMLL